MAPEERTARMDELADAVLGPAPTPTHPVPPINLIIATGLRRATALATISVFGGPDARAYVDRLMR